MSEFSILHVEDSDDDAFLLNRALSKAYPLIEVRRVSDGKDAIDYLSGLAGYSNRALKSLPNVVFLDLKMPQVDGFEVLSFIRSQPALTQLCVYILSSSNLPEDLERARALGANGYFVKSARFEDVVRSIDTLMEQCSKEPVIASGKGSVGISSEYGA